MKEDSRVPEFPIIPAVFILVLFWFTKIISPEIIWKASLVKKSDFVRSIL